MTTLPDGWLERIYFALAQKWLVLPSRMSLDDYIEFVKLVYKDRDAKKLC